MDLLLGLKFVSIDFKRSPSQSSTDKHACRLSVSVDTAFFRALRPENSDLSNLNLTVTFQRQPQMPPHPYHFGMHTRFGDDSDDTIQRPALQNLKQFNSQTSFFNNGSFQQNQRCNQQVNYIQGNQQQQHQQQQQHTFNHPNIAQVVTHN